MSLLTARVAPVFTVVNPVFTLVESSDEPKALSDVTCNVPSVTYVLPFQLLLSPERMS